MSTHAGRWGGNRQHTLLHHVTHWTARSKRVLLDTTVFGGALPWGGVSEKWTETPVASRRAILSRGELSARSIIVAESKCAEAEKVGVLKYVEEGGERRSDVRVIAVGMERAARYVACSLLPRDGVWEEGEREGGRKGGRG